MGKHKHRKQRHAAGEAPVDEEREIRELRAALQPVLDAGVKVQRIASACGAHPLDMQGFVEGRVSLTFELRRRLREQLAELLHDADPNRL
ncbi:MAG TPA: hypothetical protein VMV18_01540 [bacterium]|nr:hypothetical protein [bacterium]